jgi:hypothetical protein
LFFGLLDLEDKSTTTLKNVGNYSPNNTASLPGRPESLTFPISGQGHRGGVKRGRRRRKKMRSRRRRSRRGEGGGGQQLPSITST